MSIKEKMKLIQDKLKALSVLKSKNEIEELTEVNDHSGALLVQAKMTGNAGYIERAEHIVSERDRLGHLPAGLYEDSNQLRKEIEKYLELQELDINKEDNEKGFVKSISVISGVHLTATEKKHIREILNHEMYQVHKHDKDFIYSANRKQYKITYTGKGHYLVYTRPKLHKGKVLISVKRGEKPKSEVEKVQEDLNESFERAQDVLFTPKKEVAPEKEEITPEKEGGAMAELERKNAEHRDKLAEIEDDDIYKKILKDSMGGVMFNVSDADKYDVTSLMQKWNSLSDQERGMANGLMKGVFNFIKDEYKKDEGENTEENTEENIKARIEELKNETDSKKLDAGIESLVNDAEALGLMEKLEPELEVLQDILIKILVDTPI